MYMAKVKFDNVVDAQKFVGICNDMGFQGGVDVRPISSTPNPSLGIFQPGFFQLELRANCPRTKL